MPVPDEHTPLLQPRPSTQSDISVDLEQATNCTVESHVSRSEQALRDTSVGERLPYSDYSAIDWLHDLVKDSYRRRLLHNGRGFRSRIAVLLNECSGWIVAVVVGVMTAIVAFAVDIAELTVADWKFGYCKRNLLLSQKECCKGQTNLPHAFQFSGTSHCEGFHPWSQNWWTSFAIFGGFALAFGVVSSTATLFSKRSLPTASPGKDDQVDRAQKLTGKSMYMAAGSGIPEIRTILSGFVIPHYLDFRVLFVKAFGAVFAVASGLCVGKEGPFVHTSACIGHMVTELFPKYRNNGRKRREALSTAVGAGLSAAFGAPIGGVLFSYEEMSTYFPRPVLWKTFLCSLCAAIVLKALDPSGTGRLVLFETNYGGKYIAYHYFVFVLLGISGGIWGGLFCRLNYMWSKWFRSFSIVQNYPVFEVFLVVLVTVLLQYPNPLTRQSGESLLRDLLVDCGARKKLSSWVCQNEALDGSRWNYVGLLFLACLVKLFLITITFGAKVPAGIIIPALGAGALFGRLVGQGITTISPGIFAMVGASAFLAGVTRMTISLCAIMFELTGELAYILPHMISILVAKWVAELFCKKSVYDLAQHVLGHPYLNPDDSIQLVQAQSPPHLVSRLIPTAGIMEQITVHVGHDSTVSRKLLEQKLEQLRDHGLMDSGLVLVQDDYLRGYLSQGELEFGLSELGSLHPKECRVRLLAEIKGEMSPFAHAGHDDVDLQTAESTSTVFNKVRPKPEEIDLTSFVDRTPLALSEAAPMEYAVECFCKLGLRHLMIVDANTGKLVGVCIKTQLLAYLESLQH